MTGPPTTRSLVVGGAGSGVGSSRSRGGTAFWAQRSHQWHSTASCAQVDDSRSEARSASAMTCPRSMQSTVQSARRSSACAAWSRPCAETAPRFRRAHDADIARKSAEHSQVDRRPHFLRLSSGPDLVQDHASDFDGWAEAGHPSHHGPIERVACETSSIIRTGDRVAAATWAVQVSPCAPSCPVIGPHHALDQALDHGLDHGHVGAGRTMEQQRDQVPLRPARGRGGAPDGRSRARGNRGRDSRVRPCGC